MRRKITPIAKLPKGRTPKVTDTRDSLADQLRAIDPKGKVRLIAPLTDAELIAQIKAGTDLLNSLGAPLLETASVTTTLAKSFNSMGAAIRKLTENVKPPAPTPTLFGVKVIVNPAMKPYDYEFLSSGDVQMGKAAYENLFSEVSRRYDANMLRTLGTEDFDEGSK